MTIPHNLEPVSISGSRVGVVLGPGTLARVGSIVKTLGASRVLLVSDPGIVAAGHPVRAMKSLRDAGIDIILFDGVAENPTTAHVAAGVAFAREGTIDCIIGLGGGSSMDCAKGINFILTNGGAMQDYWGIDLAKRPLLPMLAIPTTAGTGSDAQSFALITDPATHQKMACGDKSALPRVAILDSDLTATQPAKVAAATGIDAITHAIESSASTKRNDVSRQLSKMAWKALSESFETAMSNPSDEVARERMLVGAHLAGAAIENSMLGAAHALANALTAECGIVHGVAVGMMLPHVIRYNSANRDNPYADLDPDPHRLASRVETFLRLCDLPTRLSQAGIGAERIESLVPIAARQWTAKFNSRAVGETEMREILEQAT